MPSRELAMDPVGKALWYVEGHLTAELTLEDIAAVSGVSRFYLVRAFGAATGQPVMRYVRGRRLSQAARRLSNGAPDILTVALDAGYGSHEAFTRAFRDHFGLTPEAVRAERLLDTLPLMEPILLNETLKVTLDPPRVVEGAPMLVAGLQQTYGYEDSAGIPSQWERFNAHLGTLAAAKDGAAYGVCHNFDDRGTFDYLSGVEVRELAGLPPEFSHMRIPAQRYAVFTNREHISTIRSMMVVIWRQWLPESGCEASNGPLLERYGPTFDARSGQGGFEVWVPLKA